MQPLSLHAMMLRDGGFTLDADGFVPGAGYAVGLTLNNTVFLQGRGDPADVERFAANADGPIGGWYDPDKDLTTLESVEIIHNLEAALLVAQKFAQTSIYDLKNKRLLDVE